MDDKEKLFEENIKLVPFILNKYYFAPYKIYGEDLYQEACIGLWTACLHYNPSKSKFSTYATKAIRRHVARFIEKENRPTRKPKEPIFSLDYKIITSDEKEVCFGDTIEAPPVSRLLKPLKDILNEPELATFLLYSEGMPVEEIARHFGMSREGIYLRLRKAKKKIEDNIIYI